MKIITNAGHLTNTIIYGMLTALQRLSDTLSVWFTLFPSLLSPPLPLLVPLPTRTRLRVGQECKLTANELSESFGSFSSLSTKKGKGEESGLLSHLSHTLISSPSALHCVTFQHHWLSHRIRDARPFLYWLVFGWNLQPRLTSLSQNPALSENQPKSPVLHSWLSQRLRPRGY